MGQSRKNAKAQDSCIFKDSRAQLRNACIDIAGGDDLMFADGLDEAILGVAERDGTIVVVYDIQCIVKILIERDGMSAEEAEEFFNFNIARAYFGSCTPMYLSKIQ